MRISWKDYDDLMKFEVVLEKIRKRELREVTVIFTKNAGRLHYEFEATIDDNQIAKALGFRELP